ncbi:MAG: hypothetical protein ACR2G5_08790 [Pyrinomonadaceae bacterium]
MEELNRPRTFAERHAIEKARLADQALGKAGRDQVGLAMAALSSTAWREQVQGIALAVGESVRHQLAAQMANIGVSAIVSMHKEMSRLGVDVSKATTQSYSAITPDVLQSIRALSAVNDSPVRFAMETIRSMRFEVESPVFTEFVSDALQQSEPLTEKTLEKVGKSHLSETKLSRTVLNLVRRPSLTRDARSARHCLGLITHSPFRSGTLRGTDCRSTGPAFSKTFDTTGLHTKTTPTWTSFAMKFAAMDLEERVMLVGFG